VHTFNNLFPFHHSCCLTDLKYDSKDKPAYFNFIILREWGDTTRICEIFGDSIVRVTEGGYRFYLVPEFAYDESYFPVLTGKYDFESLRKQISPE